SFPTRRSSDLVGERIAADECVIRIAERGAQGNSSGTGFGVGVGEGEPDGKRLEVRHRVPLTARDAAKKEASTGANRGLAIAKRSPSKTDAWPHMMPAHGNQDALHS